MKIVPTKDIGPKKAPPILPLEDSEEEYLLDKTNSVTFELYTIPGTTTSTKYKYPVRILTGFETPRQLIRWRNDLAIVVKGLNLTLPAEIYAVHIACMRTGPLAVYQESVEGYKEEAYDEAMKQAKADDAAASSSTATVTTEQDKVRNKGKDGFLEVIHLQHAVGVVVVADALPRKALEKAKRALRRDMRKPVDMKVRKYYQSLIRINNEELPNLPPFERDQKLSQDEIIDILLHGTPRSWQNEMDRQGFDPMDKHPNEVVDFMENIESVEERPFEKPKAKSSKDSKKSDKGSSPNKKKSKYYCSHHGPNNTHDSKDCLVLKNGGGKTSSNNNKSKNKTWTKKAAEANSASKKELAALIDKQVKKGVKKQLAAASKKRGSDDSDSDSDKECFLLETLQKGIDGFNYEEMEKLSINDDISDEVSV